MSTLVYCYNKGCGKQYSPTDNNEDSCVYHPGVPVFHDAYKGWSCCNKKSTDFSTFLSFVGCAKSFHSNIKPVEPEKPKTDKSKVDEVIIVQGPKPVDPSERPSGDEPLIELKKTVAANLEKALESLKLIAENQSQNDSTSNATIPIGTSCKNHGCQSSYQGIQSDQETCTHHPGQAIFHEGMKYWSCCQRKTSDFNNFLNQEGCTQSKHTWFKNPSDSKEKNADCRYDFHQTSSHAYVTVFSKNPTPNECLIKANKITLDINISFEAGQKSFIKKFNLYGIIDVEQSVVNYYQSKVEIKMKKAEPLAWKKLEFTE